MFPLIHKGIAPRGVRASRLPLSLTFGVHLTTLRFLRPNDAAHLVAFFASHTPETIHDRYGFPFHLSPERAAQSVGVDQSREAALGVFLEDQSAALIAVGRYYLADDGKSAELAFIVREDCRRLGITTALLRMLVAIARERGLARLTAQVQTGNDGMLAVFRKAGATFASLPESGTVEGTLEVSRCERSSSCRISPEWSSKKSPSSS